MIPKFEVIKKGGYNPNQVDNYIENLRGEYNKILDVCNRLSERVKELEPLEREKNSIATAIITAQTLIDEGQDEAKKRADEIICLAERQANETLKLASVKAERIARDALQTKFQVQKDLENISQMLEAFLEKGERTNGN